MHSVINVTTSESSASLAAKHIAVIMGHLSMHSLAWGSSEVDWCESNYKITSCVAEFWNTLSNALFFIIPPVLVYLFRPYARRVNRGVNVVWALLVVVGLGSVYFHSTLSLVGQLLDEIAIIWVFMAALGLWYPKRYMSAMFHRSRQWFQAFMLCLSVLTSCLALISPAINSIVLFILGIPATTLLVLELKRCGSARVYNMGVRCGVMWIIALASWLSDRMFCHFWEAIHFPYMHCFWHILIFLASSHCCILFAYFDAKEEVPDANPRLRFWPCDEYDLFGIPYISFHPLEPNKLEQKVY